VTTVVRARIPETRAREEPRRLVARGFASRWARLATLLVLGGLGARTALVAAYPRRMRQDLRPAGETFLYPGGWRIALVQPLPANRVRLTIEATRRGDSVVLERAPPPSGGDSVGTMRWAGRAPFDAVVPLSPGRNEYVVGGTGLRGSPLVLHYTPPAIYERASNSGSPLGALSLLRSGLPIGVSASSVEFWRVPAGMLPAERTAFDSLVRARVGPGKLREVEVAFMEWLRDRRGTPSDAMLASPVEQLHRLELGVDHAWCTNISTIAAALAADAGYAARMVNLVPIGTGADVTTGHTFNEVFDSSSGRWRLVDLTFGFSSVARGGQPLSALELRRILRAGAAASRELTFAQWSDSAHAFRATPWEQLPDSTREMMTAYYAAPASVLAYTRGESLDDPLPDGFIGRVLRRLHRASAYVYAEQPALSAASWYAVGRLRNLSALVAALGGLLLVVLAVRSALRARAHVRRPPAATS
jgi:hypothetical protein